MVWDTVTAIAAAIGVVIAVASAAAACGSWQTAVQALKVAKDSKAVADNQRDLTERIGRRDALLRAYEAMNDPSLIQARLELIGVDNLPKVEELYEPHGESRFTIRRHYESTYQAMRRACTAYEALGLLIDRKLITPDDAYELSPWAPPLWDRLRPYVDFERGRGRPRHLEHFENLAKGARGYWERRDREE